MGESPFQLDVVARRVVVAAIEQVCSHRAWQLHAANALTSHVHVVVTARARPEKVMGDFKSYSSRALARLDSSRNRRWARHGSTRWLNTTRSLHGAIRYVVEGQESDAAVYWAGNRHW